MTCEHSNAPAPVSTDDRLSDDEWLKRYDAYITKRSGFDGSYSQVTGAAETLKMFRAPDECFDNYPEDAADEEMSNWDDDGESA